MSEPDRRDATTSRRSSCRPTRGICRRCEAVNSVLPTRSTAGTDRRRRRAARGACRQHRRRACRGHHRADHAASHPGIDRHAGRATRERLRSPFAVIISNGHLSYLYELVNSQLRKKVSRHRMCRLTVIIPQDERVACAQWERMVASRERLMSARQTIVGLAIAVGGGAVGVVLIGTILHRSPPNSTPLAATVNGTAQTAAGTVPHAFLNLDTYPDSMAGEHGSDGGAHPDWVSYGPSTNLHVPAHALVTVTIKPVRQRRQDHQPVLRQGARHRRRHDDRERQDGRPAPIPTPSGTPSPSTPHRPTRIRCSSACRCRRVPDDRPVAKGSAYPAPNVVTFSFMTGGKGEYVWNCEFPCGDGFYAKFGGPMSTRGYMSGTLTVG